MDLLVSHSWYQFHRARPEIMRILRRFGDPSPQVEKTAVRGIAIAHTRLDNREVIKQCRAVAEKEAAFEFAIKWVPVDYWCRTELEAMKTIIEERIKDRIEEGRTWAMKVEKHGWRQYHRIDIIEYLAAGIARKVNLGQPDWIIRIDVLGKKTAISLLKAGEIFSLGLPYP